MDLTAFFWGRSISIDMDALFMSSSTLMITKETVNFFASFESICIE